MSLLTKADGYQALIRLTQALAKSEGEDADLIVDGLNELADRTDAFLTRYDSPETAALKCANAVDETPPAVPQRAADSGAHALEPRTRAAPSTPARSP